MMHPETNILRDSVRKPGGDARRQYGVLPWRADRNGDVKLLLITSRRRGRWIVPKGWPNEGRAPFMSAALEAFQEAGIIGDTDSAPLTDFHYLKQEEDGSQERIRVTLFGMAVRGTLSHWREKGERRRKWFPIGEAADRLDDVELARFVRRLASDPARLTRQREDPHEARDLVDETV